MRTICLGVFVSGVLFLRVGYSEAVGVLVSYWKGYFSAFIRDYAPLSAIATPQLAVTVSWLFFFFFFL